MTRTDADADAGIDAHVALRRLAAHGLRADDTTPIEVAALDQLLILADTQRVLSPVYRAARAGMVDNADAAWMAALRERALTAAESTLAVHAAAMTTVERLDSAGVPAVVMKGCSTGPIDQAHAADRFVSDVDVLVPIDRRAAAIGALGDATVDVSRRQGWHDRYGHATTVAGPIDVNIDVHVRIDHGYVGLAAPPEAFFEGRETYDIGGQPMFAPDLANRLIIAAVHSAGRRPSLHARRDVPQLVLCSNADWKVAVERAERWQVDSFFASGVLAAWSSFELASHPIVEWAQSQQPVGRQRVLALIPGDGRRRQVLAGPLALPARRWPGYVGPLLFPSREYVHSTGKGWRQRLRIVRSEFRRD